MADEPYWLGRASAEQQRLAKQHHIWTKSIGYLIHPSIAKTLPNDTKIADVGTGTGIWMTESAKTTPSTYQYDGYDISDGQFMDKDALPSNVTLQLGDFKKPFPEELHGKYDMINIRLIVISMGNDVWNSTLRNVLTLLKPGGAIQWIEGNFFIARGFRGIDAGSTGGHYLTRVQIQLNTILTKRFGYNFPEWTSFFEGEGLKDVEEDVLSTDRLPEQRTEFTEIGIGAVLGGLKNLASIKEQGYWSEEQVDDYHKKALDDKDSGAYLRWDIHVTVGFKSKEA
ncbi:hypothetical protein BU24DRAFT_417593 [Aaosphaeria arxii CBS 175.79]|uniref:Methyltransferase domain-containing protein n=1 Tax=Aaosphaeria arxii CBS 175.79 TaxID=1450172 RepID=A0A6A5Y955_9PLEO|nr:uncharacterized protein BU24DRAFT_417593 [Aaosphaeria arxii CBS 175.79]KAF2021948.1 hypothetical protein BU24DRAFT_417593 [Aaosphaeria arxii CBS 175.79]